MKRKTLPPLDFAAVVAAYPAYRQSLLGNADNCMLSARFDLEGRPFTNAAQARGIILHRYAAELLRTLKRTGEVKMPIAEAMEILYEVCAQRDVPIEDVVVVPMRERRTLRILAVMLAQLPMNMTKLIEVERRLFATVRYNDPEHGPVERQITGQPDALLADPPSGAVVIDWKSAPKPPPKGSGFTISENDDGGDPAHVSYEGYFQQRVYALLVMANYPSVQHVTLREYYVMAKEGREATVARVALEHIERELGEIASLLDRALVGGSRSPLWQPSPGKHCGYCRSLNLCPIERDARVREGGITGPEQARQVAAEFVLADEVRSKHREALKAYVDATGRAIPVKSAKGRYELRWGTDSGGRRRFDLHVPATSDRGPEDADLAAAFGEAAERRAA